VQLKSASSMSQWSRLEVAATVLRTLEPTLRRLLAGAFVGHVLVFVAICMWNWVGTNCPWLAHL